MLLNLFLPLINFQCPGMTVFDNRTVLYLLFFLEDLLTSSIYHCWKACLIFCTVEGFFNYLILSSQPVYELMLFYIVILEKQNPRTNRFRSITKSKVYTCPKMYYWLIPENSFMPKWQEAIRCINTLRKTKPNHDSSSVTHIHT